MSILNTHKGSRALEETFAISAARTPALGVVLVRACPPGAPRCPDRAPASACMRTSPH